MEPQLTLRRLEIFRLVVEERSVTRAAARLMIAQPAVSSQLRALEDWLGAKLFVRRGNQLDLTEAGERTEVWARNVLASGEELRRDVEGIESGTGGTAVAAASMGLGSYLMPALLTRFRESHPDADITLNVAQPQEVLRLVAAREADFAVTTWNTGETRTDVASAILREEPLVLIVRADLSPPTGALALDDALRLPLVGAPRGVAAQQSVDSQLRRLSDVEPTFIIRLGHAMPTKQAVIDHGWAAILPRYAVTADVTAGTLAIVDVPELQLQESIALVWHPDKVFSKLQQKLMRDIRRELGDPLDARHSIGDTDPLSPIP